MAVLLAGLADVAEAYEGSDRVVTAVRVTTAVVIDGRLDDEAWKAATPVGGFVERTPRLRAEPADKTSFRVLYDADALYLGVDCQDSQPDRIKAVTRSRDAFTIFADDAVTLKLDPAHDHRTTFAFALNPAGAQLDYIAANEGNLQRGWDAIWDGAAVRHAGGWSAEWRIPWVALGIDPSSPPAEIGLNLSRDHPRRSATYDWSVMAPPLSPFSPSRYGHIQGLVPILGAGRAFELKPYVLLSSETPGEALKPSIGGDVAIGLGGGWRTQLSVLTDFAQVDVDDQVVNLSRYSLFFPEKRDFFLRDSDLFVFGWEGDSQLFHSRTIGIGDDGEVPILGGAKAVGPIGDIGRVGVLSVVTQPQGDLGWTDNDVLRVVLQSADGSNAGLMVTRRGNLTTGDAQHVVGLDAAWRGQGTPLLIEGTAMGEPDGGVDQTGATAAMFWRGELVRPGAWYTWFGEDFAPELGFYRRTGVHATGLSMQVEPRIDRAGVQKIAIGAETDQSFYARGADIWDKRYSTYSKLYWDSGYSLAVTLSRRDEVVDDPFDLLGETPISAGRYVTEQIRVSGSTPVTLPFGASGAIRQGGYFGGKLIESGTGIFLRPSPALRLEANALVAQVKFDDPAKRDITAAVINGRIGTALSTSLTLDTFLRWNRLEALASTVVRLRWTYMRGGDLFVVWQSDLDADDGTSKLQSIQAKLTATWSP